MFEDNASLALRDKRNLMHTSEQKKRRENIFQATRKKLIKQSYQTQQDMENVVRLLQQFTVNSLATREGRRSTKDGLQFIGSHSFQFQAHHHLIMKVARHLVQLPINESTISIIYNCLQMLISVGIDGATDIIGDLWKLIGGSLKYIHQQHGYLLVKCCIIVIGNSYLDLPKLSNEHCTQDTFANINELLQTGDKGIILEAFWFLNNLIQISTAESTTQIIANLMQYQFIAHCLRFIERFVEDSEIMKELLWLFVQVTRICPSENARVVALESLRRLQPQQDRQVLLAFMILSLVTCSGQKDPLIVQMVVHFYSKTSPYCQREMLVCLANLFVDNSICKTVFLECNDWMDIILHAMRFYQLDSMLLVYNLIINDKGITQLLRQNHEFIVQLKDVLMLMKTTLPEEMIQLFSFLVY